MPAASDLLSSCWRLLRAAAQQVLPSAGAMPCSVRTHLGSACSNSKAAQSCSWRTGSMHSGINQPTRGIHACIPAAVQQRDGTTAQKTSSTLPKRRFYKKVNVVQAKDGSGLYHVHLDGRPVRTPGKHVLALPSYSLALAIAAEWEWQTSGKPQMHSMPLMSIAATALDQPKPRDKVIETLLKYVHTDATCCRVEDQKVAARQAEVHDPLLTWAASSLAWHLQPSDQLFAPPQSDDTVTSVQRMLEGLSAYELAAMEQLAAVCKSVVIAAALLQGRIGIQEALTAARVEEDCQTAEWGTVEAGHDLDLADITTRIAAPSVFLRLLALADKPCTSTARGTAG